MSNTTTPVTFSFVCPVYNEQDGLEAFYKRLKTVADALHEPYEILFVNDGSRDQSASIIEQLVAGDHHVRYVEFSRNFGHQWAVTAGYDYAAGKVVISLDSDGQHPPELIPDMIAKWREGYEIVCTVRQDTQGISPVRRAIGRMAYRVIRMATGADLTDQADFRLMDRLAVEALKSAREQARFVRGLVHWIGFKQYKMPYTAERRMAGRSSYSLRQLVGMSTAGVFNFSNRPLKLASWLGCVLLVAAAVYLPVSLVLWALGAAPPASLSVVVAVGALFGLQFMLMGLLGEYVGRIFDESKDRPLYIVRRTLGFQRGVLDSGESAPANKPEVRSFAVYT
jgi:dolichol-phosphate mannosyltransferase